MERVNMSESKIRKVTSTSLRPINGPASAGIAYDATKDALMVNPDGTERLIQEELHINLGLDANLGGAARCVFIADAAYKVVSIKSVVAVGVSGATATVKKTTGTTAPGSGDDVTAATINLNTTANTVTDNALHATAAQSVLASGDRIWITPSTATLTGLAGGIQIVLKRQ